MLNLDKEEQKIFDIIVNSQDGKPSLCIKEAIEELTHDFSNNLDIEFLNKILGFTILTYNKNQTHNLVYIRNQLTAAINALENAKIV